jgi:hypothetical protein
VNSNCRFDPKRAYEHTQALCYPRRVGTPRERRAARYIWRQFTAWGLVCEREVFEVSHFAVEIGNRLAFLTSALAVLLGVALFAGHPAIAIPCLLVAALVVQTPWQLSRRFGAGWPPRSTSQNILASLPKSLAEAPARVIFMAHYDTKSQVIPTGVRVALVAGVTTLCTAAALLGVVNVVGLISAPSTLGWITGIAALPLLLGLACNVTGNRSPGALDNGSAVGTLLELARYWQSRPQAALEVIWVASGAEEVGLDGARQFLRRRESWWSEKPTLLINLECVGAGSHIYLAGEPRALALARASAEALHLPHSRPRVMGAGMDHEVFAARGLTALSILGDVVGNSLVLHTPRDTMRLIDPRALERAAQLATQLAWRWAELHAPTVR